MKTVRLLCLMLSLLCLSQAAAQNDSAAKRADIEKLLRITGALNIGVQMSDVVVSQMAAALKRSRPDLPPKIFDALKEEVHGVIRDNLPRFVDMIVPLYDKYYSHDDIKGLIRFYETELGQKSIRTLPSLVQESMELGRRWGESMGPEIQRRVLQRLKTEGVDLSA